MTTSRIGRGAIVTLGAAASMAWAAGAANACTNPTPHPKPKPPAPPTQHKSDHLCTVDDSDVDYAVSDQSGNPVGDWHKAQGFWRTPDEPIYGYVVRLNAKGCTGSVDISLASYDTDAAKWEDTKVAQKFVDFSTATLSTKSKDSTTAHLTVKLPNAAGGTCFGQIDLYPGHEKFDGRDADHGLPDYPAGKAGALPKTPFTAWNGSDTAGTCSTSTQPAPPPATTTTPPSTPPSSSPTTPPSTSASSTPPAPKPSTSTSTTPSTPATTTSPGTPTLAHTGANVGEVSLVALAFFGAGGTAMVASRKAKTAGARKH
jgi:hypothetical protein